MKNKLPALLFSIVFLIFCSHCSQKPTSLNPNKVEQKRLLMGSIVEVQIQKNKKENIEPIFNQFSELNHLLSTYQPGSEISQLNQGQEIQASEDTLNLLKQAQTLNKKTNGYFNIFVGAKTLQSRKTPHLLFLKKIKTHNSEILFTSNNKISLPANSKIDLGGILKGYAIDKAIDFLIKQKVKFAQVFASGDYACLGPCQISIPHPFTNSLLARFESSQKRISVSSTGSYSKKAFSHIVNPKTGKYVDHWASVTLFANNNNTLLDGLTTSIFSMPNKEALSYLKKHQIDYLLVDHNKNVFISNHLHKLIKNLKWYNTRKLHFNSKN